LSFSVGDLHKRFGVERGRLGHSKPRKPVVYRKRKALRKWNHSRCVVFSETSPPLLMDVAVPETGTLHQQKTRNLAIAGLLKYF